MNAMTGKHNSFVNLMKQFVPHKIITHHCILHQKQLYAKTLEMQHIMDNVVVTVNFIRARGLTTGSFKSFSEDLKQNKEMSSTSVKFVG